MRFNLWIALLCFFYHMDRSALVRPQERIKQMSSACLGPTMQACALVSETEAHRKFSSFPDDRIISKSVVKCIHGSDGLLIVRQQARAPNAENKKRFGSGAPWSLIVLSSAMNSLLIGAHLPTCNGSSIRTELFIANAKSTLTGLPGSINSEDAAVK
jgi:hypothetical protein